MDLFIILQVNQFFFSITLDLTIFFLFFQPLKHGMNTGCSHGDTCIRSAVIDMQGVSVRCKSVTTWEDDFIHVSVLLIWFFRTKYPLVAAFQAALWFIQIK
jgi:hypothetical protein